jgi:HK97 family phage major capsid protein
MKTIADRIKEKETFIAAQKDALAAIDKAASGEERDMTDDEEALVDEHSSNIEAAAKELKSLYRLEASLGREVERSITPRGNAQAKTSEGKPDAVLVRAATANFLAHVRKQPFDQVIREVYGDDARMDAVAKAATTNATTTQVGWAAELVHVGFQAMLEELKPDFVYPRLAAQGLTIDFGSNGSVSIPHRNPGGLAGAFVQEGGTIPVKMGSLGTATLNKYKMGVISAFTKELASSSIPSIEAIIRDGIRTDTGVAIDTALLDGQVGVAAVRPASILYGVTGIPSTGNTPANILADMTALLAGFAAVNSGRRLVTIMNPKHVLGLATVVTANGVFLFKEEVNGGRFMGTTLIASTTVPVGKVIMIDAADFATGLGSPEFDVSDTATLVMANDNGTAPTMSPTGAITLAGSIPVSGAALTTPPTAVQSLFQTWSIAVRMVMPLSWGLLRTGAVNQITGVTW